MQAELPLLTYKQSEASLPTHNNLSPSFILSAIRVRLEKLYFGSIPLGS
jgi:hypothetical protein